VPAAPATVGAYLASLANSHAPTTIRKRLSALGKMHRFNDLAWNPAHRDIQGPLQGALRRSGRPVQKAAALTLPMLRQSSPPAMRVPVAGATAGCCCWGHHTICTKLYAKPDQSDAGR
jgi:hypothetical protein